jgi:hypothetical protein
MLLCLHEERFSFRNLTVWLALLDHLGFSQGERSSVSGALSLTADDLDPQEKLTTAADGLSTSGRSNPC